MYSRIQDFFKGFFIYYYNSYRQPKIKPENPRHRFELSKCFRVTLILVIIMIIVTIMMMMIIIIGAAAATATTSVVIKQRTNTPQPISKSLICINVKSFSYIIPCS